MTRMEYNEYNRLNSLLKIAYHVADRYARQRAVATIQAKMAELIGDN